MKDIDTRFFRVNVEWHQTGDAEYLYQAIVDKQTWIVRINDFPEEPLYTLIIDDEEIVSFENWPHRWIR